MKLNKFIDHLRENYEPEDGSITVNLWDDYVDDGYGDQETFILVEEEMPDELKKEVYKVVLEYIQKEYKNDQAKFSLSFLRGMFLNGQAILVKDLTHAELDGKLLPLLKGSNLKFRQWPIRFISES